MLRSRLLDLLGRIPTPNAVLVIHHLDLFIREPGQFLGRPHVAHLLDIPLGEDEVDLLETAVRGLRVEEVDDGDEGGVQRREEQVRAPVDAGHHDRGDHDYGEVEEPVGAGGDGVRFRARLDGREFSRVQPGKGKPGGAEAGHVEEEAKDGALLGALAVGDQTGKGDHHGDELDPRAVEKEVAAADLLDEEPGEGGENGVHDHVDTADEQSELVLFTQGVLEEHRQVVDHRVATTELLEDLRRRTNKHTPAVLRAATGQQVGELGLVTSARPSQLASFFYILAGMAYACNDSNTNCFCNWVSWSWTSQPFSAASTYSPSSTRS